MHGQGIWRVVASKYLNARVARVGNNHRVIRANCDAPRVAKLPLPAALFAVGLDPHTLLGENLYPIIPTVAHVHKSFAVDCDAVWVLQLSISAPTARKSAEELPVAIKNLGL